MSFDFTGNGWLVEERQMAFGEASALYGCTFDSNNGTVPQIEKARQYADRWKDMEAENMGLLFWGASGNGKTFAAACIANALLTQGRRVRMTTLGEVLNRLPTLAPGDKLHYLTDLKTCDLLILDDFGIERRTDYAQEQIFGLIDGRYLARRPLIVTTNLSLRDLKNPEDLTQRRIYDRILEMCIPVYFDGESLRTAKATEKMLRYKQLVPQENTKREK